MEKVGGGFDGRIGDMRVKWRSGIIDGGDGGS